MTYAVMFNSAVVLVTLVLLVLHLRKNGTAHRGPLCATDIEKVIAMAREVHRLSGRMSEFEVGHHQLINRIETMSHAAIERQKETSMMLSELTSASLKQLEEIRHIGATREVLERHQAYVKDKLESLPCVANEANNGGESCPDGEPIEGAGKMDVFDKDKGGR